MHGIRTKIRRMSQNLSFWRGKNGCWGGWDRRDAWCPACIFSLLIFICMVLSRIFHRFFLLHVKKNPITRKIDFRSCHSVRFLGKNGPNNQNPEDLPRFYKIAHQMKILSKIVKNRQKRAKNRQKMAKKPDFSGFPKNAENRRFSENRKQ